jgi:hypothetical protein
VWVSTAGGMAGMGGEGRLDDERTGRGAEPRTGLLRPIGAHVPITSHHWEVWHRRDKRVLRRGEVVRCGRPGELRRRTTEREDD